MLKQRWQNRQKKHSYSRRVRRQNGIAESVMKIRWHAKGTAV